MTENHKNTEPATETTDETATETSPNTVEPPSNVEQTESTETSETSTDDADDSANPNKEAAKWRKKLRETESERDKLVEQLEAYRRREVESYAQNLQKPEAIWAAGLKLETVLDDEGQIDPEKVTQAVDVAVTQLGLSVKPRAPRPHPAQMQLGDSGSPGGAAEDVMSRIIAGKKP